MYYSQLKHDIDVSTSPATDVSTDPSTTWFIHLSEYSILHVRVGAMDVAIAEGHLIHEVSLSSEIAVRSFQFCHN